MLDFQNFPISGKATKKFSNRANFKNLLLIPAEEVGNGHPKIEHLLCFERDASKIGKCFRYLFSCEIELRRVAVQYCYGELQGNCSPIDYEAGADLLWSSAWSPSKKPAKY